MLNVKILSADLRDQPYKDKRDGSPKIVRFQTAWVYTVDKEGKPGPFPEKLEFVPERDPAGQERAYAPGDYTLHPSAVFINKDGRLDANLRLTPARARAAA